MADRADMPARNSTKAGTMAASGTRSVGSPQRTTAPRKRVRNFTADDRAAHRVFEKSRREAFKHRLIELAGLLPSMVEVDNRRLSKHVVVDESINRHRLQHKRCEAAAHSIRSLLEERDTLLAEVNRWRSGTGEAALMPTVGVGNFSGIFAAEQEAFKEKLGTNAATPPMLKAERSNNAVGLMIDEDGYASGTSPAGSVDGMSTMRVGVVMDSGLRGVDLQQGGGIPDKDIGRRQQQQQRPHDMDMHRSGIFTAFDMAGMPPGQAPPQHQPQQQPPPSQPQPQHHHQPQPHHPQPSQQHQPPPRLPGMPGEYLTHPAGNGMRVGVDPRHSNVSPPQQPPMAPPGQYDPVAAAAHGHAHAGHGHAPPMSHHEQGQHMLPTTQAQYMNHHMGTMPYMSNMWQ